MPLPGKELRQGPGKTGPVPAWVGRKEAVGASTRPMRDGRTRFARLHRIDGITVVPEGTAGRECAADRSIGDEDPRKALLRTQ